MDQNYPAPQSLQKSINCSARKLAVKASVHSKRGDHRVLLTVSVSGNSVRIGHIMKWLAVEVAMPQTDDSDVY